MINTAKLITIKKLKNFLKIHKICFKYYISYINIYKKINDLLNLIIKYSNKIIDLSYKNIFNIYFEFSC